MAAEGGPAGGEYDRDYFERVYRDYERQNPPGKLAHYHRAILALTGGREGLRLLDVGCGPGAFLAHLREHEPTWELAGSDVSRYALDQAADRLPGVELFRAGADQTPLPEGSCDVITAWDVIEHVPDLEAVGRAVAGMLRPGGVFLFLVPVYDGVTGPLVHLLDRDPTHVHKRGRGFWLDWAAGRFEVVRWEGVVRFLLPGGIYLHRPTVRLRRLAPAILVAASA